MCFIFLSNYLLYYAALAVYYYLLSKIFISKKYALRFNEMYLILFYFFLDWG